MEPIAQATQTGELGGLRRRQSDNVQLRVMNQKAKNLVTLNNKKNQAIWIKSNSVVRVPKYMRKSHEKALELFYDAYERKGVS